MFISKKRYEEERLASKQKLFDLGDKYSKEVNELQRKLEEKKNQISSLEGDLLDLDFSTSTITTESVNFLHELELKSISLRRIINNFKLNEGKLRRLSFELNRVNDKAGIESQIKIIKVQRDDEIKALKDAILSTLKTMDSKISEITKNIDSFKRILDLVSSKRFGIIIANSKGLNINNAELQHITDEINFLNRHFNMIKSSLENNIINVNKMIREIPFYKNNKVDIFVLPKVLKNSLEEQFSGVNKTEDIDVLSKYVEKLILFENGINQILHSLVFLDNVNQAREQIRDYKKILLQVISDIKIKRTNPENIEKAIDSSLNGIRETTKKVYTNIIDCILYSVAYCEAVVNKRFIDIEKDSKIKWFVSNMELIKKNIKNKGYNYIFYDNDFYHNFFGVYRDLILRTERNYGSSVGLDDYKKNSIYIKELLKKEIELANNVREAKRIFNECSSIQEKFYRLINDNENFKEKIDSINTNNWTKEIQIYSQIYPFETFFEIFIRGIIESGAGKTFGSNKGRFSYWLK